MKVVLAFLLVFLISVPSLSMDLRVIHSFPTTFQDNVYLDENKVELAFPVPNGFQQFLLGVYQSTSDINRRPYLQGRITKQALGIGFESFFKEDVSFGIMMLMSSNNFKYPKYYQDEIWTYYKTKVDAFLDPDTSQNYWIRFHSKLSESTNLMFSFEYLRSVIRSTQVMQWFSADGSTVEDWDGCADEIDMSHFLFTVGIQCDLGEPFDWEITKIDGLNTSEVQTEVTTNEVKVHPVWQGKK